MPNPVFPADSHIPPALNPNAPPLSLQLRGLTTPSQVIAQMLQGYSAYPHIPESPSEIPGFWQRIGGQLPQEMTPRKRRQQQPQLSSGPGY